MKKYIQLLVFQHTDHVIWYGERATIGYPKRVPNVSKDLDYRVFNSVIPDDQLDWQKRFLNFELKKPSQSENFNFEKTPPEFYFKFQLLRVKCYKMENMINNISFIKEKLNIVDNPLMNEKLNQDKVIDSFSEVFGISKESSKKLIDFKRNEISTWIEKLELDQIRFELELEKASSFEEINEIQKKLNLNFVMGQIND